VSIPTSTTSLGRLASVIDADLGGVDELPTGESASLIRVTRTGEVGVRSLDNQHPFDALLGFVAPDDWEVLGVVAPGWGTRVDTGDRQRTRVIYVAARDGEEASLIRFAGDQNAEVLRPTERTIGRVADCVRRALDLPTAPEPDESLLASWWDRVLQKLAERNHPSFGGGKVDADSVVGIIESARPLSWHEERWAVIQRGGSALLAGDLCAWLDDGMFARLLLAELADPAVSIPAAKRACTEQAWTAVLEHFANAALAQDEVDIQ
jgi:hypothetical protein